MEPTEPMDEQSWLLKLQSAPKQNRFWRLLTETEVLHAVSAPESNEIPSSIQGKIRYCKMLSTKYEVQCYFHDLGQWQEIGQLLSNERPPAQPADKPAAAPPVSRETPPHAQTGTTAAPTPDSTLEWRTYADWNTKGRFVQKGQKGTRRPDGLFYFSEKQLAELRPARSAARPWASADAAYDHMSDVHDPG